MITRLAARLAPAWLATRAPRARDAVDVAQAQGRILARLVRRLSALPTGRRAGLDRLTRGPGLVGEFRRRVPIGGYADHAGLIERVARGERDVLFAGRAVALAQTSGTTRAEGAGERYVPQGEALLDHHAAGGAAALARLTSATGGTLFGGKLLMLGGSTSMVDNAYGVAVGDLSGICATRIPRILRGMYEPGPEIALEADWNRKLERIAERTAHADVRLVAGIPSWLIALFERLCAVRGVRRVRDAWPNLAGCIHGGCAVEPFLPALAEHLGDDCWMQEVYSASEAFVAIGARPWLLGEGAPPAMEPLAEHGCFLEFLPVGAAGGDAVGPEGVVADRLYAVLLTTPGGLVRYRLGDLVLGVGRGLIRFAGREKTRMSVFGEHVEGYCLADAIASACAATAAVVAHYHVAPVPPRHGESRGAHEWWVEFARAPGDTDRFIAAIDRRLHTLSLDYAAHRAGDAQLMPPRLRAVPNGTFAGWLAANGKLGGQHKVPQAWPDRTIADALARCAAPRVPAPESIATTSR